MNSIISNGLVTTIGDKTYLTDIKTFSGTAVVDIFGNTSAFINDAIMWHSVNVGNYIFFSNQKQNNALFACDTQSGRVQQVSELASKNLIKHENNIWFIDENTKNIMTYSLQDGSVKQFSDSKTEMFAINGNALYYSSTSGIGMIDMNTKSERAMLSSIAETMGCWNNMLVYSDFKNNGAISVYSLRDGSFFRIDSVCAESIVTYENYIFATNRKEENSICRIDIAKGEIMRIYGESAYNLHVSEAYLYFTDKEDNWCRMSVAGDNFTRIRIS